MSHVQWPIYKQIKSNQLFFLKIDLLKTISIQWSMLPNRKQVQSFQMQLIWKGHSLNLHIDHVSDKQR